MSSLSVKLMTASFAVLASVLVATPASAQEKLRIALDTNPVHVRNKGVEIFVEELKKRTGNRFAIEVYPSGQLFRDRDVPRALRQDALEMAVPGTWQLDSAEPNAALQSLPMFYGIDEATVHKVMDGKLGQYLNKKFEERMLVKVLGKWMDLGSQNTFSVKKEIKNYNDLKGMKIRYPGGTANAKRISAFGAIPLLVPWPDVPLAMSQGVMDGLLTTFESSVSSKLMDSGLKFGFEDKNLFGQYVPMMRANFFNKQPKEVQQAILESWDIAATQERKDASAAQIKAKETLIKAGLVVVVPTPAEVLGARRELMKIQPELVKNIKMDQDVVDEALRSLKEAGVGY
jgi:TRAP-type C4-dicarboxylate transport system substrate-binding protein